MTVRTDRGDEVVDGGQRGPNGGRLVHRPTATVRSHPTYQACCGPIAATRVRRVVQQRGPIREPLLTTTAGTILDGHARWQVALDRQQPTLPCIEYDLTEEEALQCRHRTAPDVRGPERLLPDCVGPYVWHPTSEANPNVTFP